MKIILLQSNFLKALGQVGKVVGNRTTLPVLSNILISAKKGKISFSATDLEVSVNTQSIGKIEEEGEITLPARLLSDFIINNKDESIEITTDGTIANLKSSHFEATIHGISPEEFPTVPEAPKEYFCSINKDTIVDALKKVSIAPATDETRPVLAGIYLLFSGKYLTIAATDSYRLAEKKISLDQELPEKKIIVPARTITEVLRLAGSENADNMMISISENQATFKIGDAYIVSRLIEGMYPNYTQIIPANTKIIAKVNHKDLLLAVKMSSLFAKDTANNNIKVVIKEGALIIASAASQSGNAKSNVDAEITGGDIEIAFNARYFLDVLSVLNTDELTLGFNDNTSSGVIKSVKDKEFVYIVMPLKLEN